MTYSLQASSWGGPLSSLGNGDGIFVPSSTLATEAQGAWISVIVKELVWELPGSRDSLSVS